MRVAINQVYYAEDTSTIDIPVETFDQIKKWYVKWGNFHYTLDDQTWHEIKIDAVPEVTDYKYPANASAHNVLPDGTLTDFGASPISEYCP